MSVFIHDGYTVNTTVAYGRHTLSVTFRPALYEERAEFQRMAGGTGADIAKAGAVAIASHIVAWDAMDEDGNIAPTKPEWVRKLHPSLFAQLLDLILGYSVPKTPNESSPEAANVKN